MRIAIQCPLCIGRDSANPIINASGLYNQQQLPDLKYRAHTQIFRNGIIEQVSNYDFSHEDKAKDLEAPMKFFVVNEFEGNFKDSLARQIKHYEVIGMLDPFIFM